CQPSRAWHLGECRSSRPTVLRGFVRTAMRAEDYLACTTSATSAARRVLSLARPRDGDKIGPLGQIDDGGTSTYHAMLLSLERRAAKGVSVSANYTFSHCINPYTTTQSLKYPPDDTYLDPNIRNLDRGNCGSDRGT